MTIGTPAHVAARRKAKDASDLIDRGIGDLLEPGITDDDVVARARMLLTRARGSEWELALMPTFSLEAGARAYTRAAVPPWTEGTSDEVVEIRGNAPVKSLGTFAHLVAASISVARAAAEERRLALTDQLTGLYNYRFFAQRIVEEAERSRRYGHPLSLVMLDSDALKRINDHFGHEQGNLHIQEIAETIRAHVRASDITVRWGGDEFLIIQPECRLGQAIAIAERIQHALVSRPFEGQDGTAMLRHLSAGVASWPETAQDPEDLFDQADQALYRAKRSDERILTAPLQPLTSEAVSPPRVGVGG